MITISPKNSTEPLKGTFSHCMYDNLTEILFIYFEKIHALPLDNNPEIDYDELCLYLSPDNYGKMRQYFVEHKTKETLL